MSSLGGSDINRVIISDNINSVVSLEKSDVFRLPLMYSSNVISSPQGFIANQVELKAVGVWNENSSGCEVLEFFKAKRSNCGKLIHILDLNLLLGDMDQGLQLTGNGICVAKDSECPQLIDADIKSVNTAEIVSNIMKSNIVNPLISGILLGALLSSPEDSLSEFDHRVRLKVTGSQIYLNDKPLLE